MADEITNKMLLEHIQAMKGDLQEQIAILNQNDKNLLEEMRAGFKDATQHRQALQEDLEATMRMLSKHEEKLARL